MADFDWTDERVERLKELFALGLSASEIADDLGDVSRAAVCGKLFRMGLQRFKLHPRPVPRAEPVSNAPTHRPRVKAAGARRHTAPSPTGRDANVVAFVLMQVRELPADDIPIEQRRTILDVGPSDCRWPYGEPGTESFFFCGAPKFRRSYCIMHAHISYQSRSGHVVSDDESQRRSAAQRRSWDRRKRAGL